MDARRKPTPAEIIDILCEALYEAAVENEKTLDDELSRSGYDPRVVKSQGEMFIQKMKGHVRLAKAQQHKKQLLKIVFQIKKKTSSMGDPKHQINAWFKEEFRQEMSNSALQVLYRKLDAIDEEDIESLLHDAELLQLWEDFDSVNDEGKKA